MEQDNDLGLESLEGPLHNSLRCHFLRYYTLQEKDSKKEENKTLAARRFGFLANITDKQEES